MKNSGLVLDAALDIFDQERSVLTTRMFRRLVLPMLEQRTSFLVGKE